MFLLSVLACFHSCWGKELVPDFWGYFAALLLAKKVLFCSKVLEEMFVTF